VNIGTLLSFAASLLLCAIGVLLVVVARAPGWARARLYAFIAFSGASYAAVDVLFSLDTISAEVVRRTGVLNFFLGSVHSVAWLAMAFATPERPLADLPRRYRWLGALTIGFGLLALIPDLVTRHTAHIVEVRWLGVQYRQTDTTPYADALSVWLLVVLALVYARFIRDYRAGVRYSGVRVVAFSVFFVCAVGEALVASGLLSFLYLADVGFLAVSVALLVETIQRVIDDARALASVSLELEGQVSRRTLERDEAREALLVAERHAALGQLAAGVGHEINNPLTYVRANLGLLAEGIESGQLPDNTPSLVADALQGAEQIQRVVADLRAYATPGVEKRQPVDVIATLESSLKLVFNELPLGVEIERDLAKAPPISADPMRLRQVLLNLLLNAGLALREASRTRPKLMLRAKTPAPGWLELEITDNGIGVAPAALAKLGEPYFSTRHNRGGTGLGLFVARGILDSLGGRLEFESAEGQGTTVRMVLPTLADADVEVAVVAASFAAEPRASKNRRPGDARILVVDDDPAVARALARQLGGAEIAHDGQAAIDRLVSGPPVDLVLCDVMMPGISGRDVFEAVSRRSPEQLDKLVFVTGGATIQDVANFLQRGRVRHFPKPLPQEATDLLLDEVIRRSREAAAPSR
jgi:signal transduction histidine kinase/ActR/RegA family two-component response regulator